MQLLLSLTSLLVIRENVAVGVLYSLLLLCTPCRTESELIVESESR